MKIKTWISIALTTMFVLAFSLCYWGLQEYFKQQNMLTAESQTNLLAGQLSDYALTNRSIDKSELPRVKSSLSLFRLLDRDGKLIVQHSFPAAKSVTPPFFDSLLQVSPLKNHHVYFENKQKISTLYTEYYPRQSVDVIWYFSIISIVIYLVVLLVTNLLLSSFIRQQQRAVNELKLGVYNIINGKYTPVANSTSDGVYAGLLADFNTMIYQVGETNKKLAERNTQLRGRVNYDALTGLANRSLFNKKINQLITLENSASKGYLLLLQLSSLAQINLKLGHIEGDVYVGRVAKKLTDEVTGLGMKSQVFRSNGGELLAIINAVNQVQIESFANDLSRVLISMDDSHYPDGVGHFSITPFTAGDSYAGLMTRLDAGLSQALSIGANSYVITDSDSKSGINYSNWPGVINDILAGDHLALLKWRLNQSKEYVLYQYEIACSFNTGGETHSAKDVFASAQRLGMACAIDKLVITEIFKRYPEQFIDKVKVATHLSIQSLYSESFLLWLKDLLEANPEIANKMVFQIPEHGVMGNIGDSARFIELVHQFGCKVCVEYFGDSLSSFHILRQLNIDMLKLDSRYTRDVDLNPEKASLIRTLTIMAHEVEIPIIAADVENDAEWHLLNQLGIDGIQGRILQQPEAFLCSSV